MDRDGRFPHENIARLKETGYLSLPIPEELGRAGCRPGHGLPGPVDPGRGLRVDRARREHAPLRARRRGRVVRRRPGRSPDGAPARRRPGVVIGGSFTDAATGLNVRASSTPAERVEGGYKIHGRKAFCSLAPALDVFYGTAGVTDGSGLLLFAIGRDAPGLSFVDTWDTMAMRGTGSWDVVFDNVFVPEFMAQVGTPWDEWDRRSERMLSWFSCTRRVGVPRHRGGRGSRSRRRTSRTGRSAGWSTRSPASPGSSSARARSTR